MLTYLSSHAVEAPFGQYQTVLRSDRDVYHCTRYKINNNNNNNLRLLRLRQTAIALVVIGHYSNSLSQLARNNKNINMAKARTLIPT